MSIETLVRYEIVSISMEGYTNEHGTYDQDAAEKWFSEMENERSISYRHAFLYVVPEFDDQERRHVLRAF